MRQGKPDNFTSKTVRRIGGLERNMQKLTMILIVLLIVIVILGTVLGLRILERFGA
jgi:preprotein translocase subunit SecG